MHDYFLKHKSQGVTYLKVPRRYSYRIAKEAKCASLCKR